MSNISGSSAGTLSNGTQFGSGLANSNDGLIMLGGGELYIMPIAGLSAIPDDATIEVPQNNIGNTDGGTKIQYKPKLTEVYNQYDQLVRRFITRESFTFKTGILNWNMQNISSLSNAQYLEDSDTRRVVFTGSGSLNTVLLRFVKEQDGAILRFTMIGQGGNGFGLEFGDKPTVIDAEIQGIQYFKNFLAEFREEISKSELNSSNSTNKAIQAAEEVQGQ